MAPHQSFPPLRRKDDRTGQFRLAYGVAGGDPGGWPHHPLTIISSVGGLSKGLQVTRATPALTRLALAHSEWELESCPKWTPPGSVRNLSIPDSTFDSIVDLEYVLKAFPSLKQQALKTTKISSEDEPSVDSYPVSRGRSLEKLSLEFISISDISLVPECVDKSLDDRSPQALRFSSSSPDDLGVLSYATNHIGSRIEEIDIVYVIQHTGQ